MNPTRTRSRHFPSAALLGTALVLASVLPSPAVQPAAVATDTGSLACEGVADALAQAPADSAAPATDADGCRIVTGSVRACRSEEATAGGDDTLFDLLCYRRSCTADAGSTTIEASRGGHRVVRGAVESVCRPTSMAAPGGNDAGPGSGASLAAGGCGDASEDGNLTASDALGILKAAVGSKTCLVCVCDVDNSNKITASDALRTLRYVVGQPVTLDCQADGNPIAWDGGGDGTSWTDALNWNLDRVPNACDDATIAAGPQVVYPSGDNGVRNVVSSAPLDITGGTLTLRGTISVPALFRIKGGTLANAHVLVPGNMAPLVFTSTGGTLKGATVESAIDSSAASSYAYIDGGITLNGTAQVGQGAGLFFLGSDEQALGGSGTIALSASGAQVYNYNNTLHVGAGITIHGSSGSVGGNQAASHMTLDGTIASDAAGTLSVGSYASWVNNGTLEATGSGTMNLSGPWSSTGTLMLDSTGTMNLGGVFGTTGIGTISRTGGTMNLVGQLVNTGHTLALDASTGSWRLLNGRITGGTVTEAGGSHLVFTTSGGTLDGVTLASGADLSAASVYTYVENGLTLGGPAQIGTGGGLFFLGSNQQELAGNATIAFTGSNGQLYNYSNTLHIGPDIHLHGPGGVVGGNQVASHMTIDGTVAVDAPGTTYVGSYASWVNNGTLSATGGGNLYLQGPWTNTGTLSLDGASTITLAGTFAGSGLGTISRSGGTINLVGQMNNASSTFTLDASTGDLRLYGGKIVGGTVGSTGGSKLVFTSTGGTLDGVTLAAAADMSAASAYTYVDNGLTLNHDLSIGASGGLFFLGSGEQSFGGTATVSLTAASSNVYNYSNTLHVGSGITIHGQGTVGGNQVGSQMTLDGTVAADAGATLYLGSYASWTNNGTMSATGTGTLTLQGPWTNHGTLSLGGTATVNLGGTFTTAGIGTISRSGGTVNLTGQLTNTASTLTLNGTTGDWRLSGGRITGGTVNQSGGKLVFTTTGGTLANVTLPGGADLSTNNAYTYVEGDLTLGGTSTLGTGSGFFFLNAGEHTLGGTATIAFGATNGQVYHYSGITLHVGPDILIHGGSGSVGSNQATGHLDNHGTIASDAGGTISVGSAGSETWTQAGTLDASAGDISTVGTWANDGTIHVGAGHALAATSGYKQNGGGTTAIDIGGLSPSSVGKVTVTGAAQLGGTLGIALTNAYVPNLGDSFTIMTFGSSSGSFATVNGLAIDAGKKFSVAVNAGSIVLTVVAA